MGGALAVLDGNSRVQRGVASLRRKVSDKHFCYFVHLNITRHGRSRRSNVLSLFRGYLSERKMPQHHSL